MKTGTGTDRRAGTSSLLFAVLASAALAGCRTEKETPPPVPSFSSPSASSKHHGPSLLTEKPLKEAVATLSAKLGGAVQLLELRVHPQRIVVQAQDSKRLANVDQYIYNAGDVSDPVPVKLQGKGKLEHNLFPLSEVRLDVIPPLAGKALEELRLQGASVTYVSVKRNLPDSVDIRIRVYVTSPRRDAYVDYDLAGNRIDPRDK